MVAAGAAPPLDPLAVGAARRAPTQLGLRPAAPGPQASKFALRSEAQLFLICRLATLESDEPSIGWTDEARGRKMWLCPDSKEGKIVQ